MEHNFYYGVQTDPITGKEYRKCVRCGKVMFEQGDDYFNMICQPSVFQQEDTRRRLEGTDTTGANL